MNVIDITEQKKIALDILIFFADFCKQKSLKYFLAYGTLIGAIRHKGFIPWDDDIDIVMPRKDYEFLIHNFPEHPYYKIMSNDINPHYGKLFAVINDIRTVKKEKLSRKRSVGTVCVNIDIFPIDFLPDSPTEQIELLSKVRQIENKLACLTYAFGRGRTLQSTIKKNIGICIFRLLELLDITSTQKLAEQHQKLLRSYHNTATAGCVANTGFNGIKEFMPRKCFEEQIDVSFEEHTFNAPKEYDLILRTIYGDYMQLPPVEKRVSHHSNICYWKDNI